MNPAFRLAIVLSMVAAGGACHASSTLVADSASATNLSAGAYVCDDVAIRLVIKRNGTYEATYEQPPFSRRESGLWEARGGDIILRRRIGGIGFSIRRLRPDRQVSGRLLWISSAGSGGGGAITYPIFHRDDG